MAQDRPAHDGQVRVGADEVVRELSQEAEELLKGCPVDLHRGVAAVKHDAVFVVVDIRGILEEPVLARNRNRDQPVIGASRVIQPVCGRSFAAAMARGSFSGLERLMVISSAP